MPTISSAERPQTHTSGQPVAHPEWSNIGIHAVAAACRRQGDEAQREEKRKAEKKAAFPFGDHDYATD